MFAVLASTLLLAAPALAPAVTPALPTSTATFQEPPEDERVDVKELLKQLDDHAGARGKEDREAVAIIDQLVQLFGDCGPKDRAAIVKGLDKCFKQKRQEDENGVRENQLYLAATTALGEMGPESVDVLLDWIGHKSHRKDIALQRLLIQKVGKLHHEDALKPLIKLLDEHDPQIQGAACEALGYYDGAELGDRKGIFEELLKLLMQAKNTYDADTSDPIARQRWEVISAPIITSLQRLSGHQEHDPQEWQRWWNKNKKADWDEEGS